VFISSVTPLVNYGTTVKTYATKYAPALAFAETHPAVVASAQKYKVQLADSAKFAPELAVIQAHSAVFARLAAYPNSAAGGGATGARGLATIAANKAPIQGVIAVAPQLKALAPYALQLTALSKVPPSAIAYLKVHGAAVTKAAAQAPGQWRAWYWLCFAGVIFFLLCVPSMHGRWRPRDARRARRSTRWFAKNWRSCGPRGGRPSATRRTAIGGDGGTEADRAGGTRAMRLVHALGRSA
jgi:hypothetical protein